MKEKPLILTVREVTILLRIHRPKVYDLIHEGIIEGFKLGSDWRVKTESVEKLIGPIPANFFNGESEEHEESDSSASETRASQSGQSEVRSRSQ